MNGICFVCTLLEKKLKNVALNSCAHTINGVSLTAL
ncbi:MAG: hypothetical protein RLZZ628_1691 [Bacteroidota bacterium]|jgi:hypothetical protein